MGNLDLDKFLKDLVSFILWSQKHGKSSAWILSNICHDIGGVVRNESCFSPRCTGYAETLAKEGEK